MQIAYMTIIVTVAFIGADVITGILQALMQHTYASIKMRQGIFHKVGFLLCICFGILADWGQTIIDLGVTIPITKAICGYVILTEIGSIIENLSLINPNITPKWLKSMFSKLNDDEGDHAALIPYADPPETSGEPLTKAKIFVSMIREYLGNIYCWGGQGEKDTAKDFLRLIDRKETSNSNRKRTRAFYAKVKATGKTPVMMFDCSGLIVYALSVMGLFKGDATANGLYLNHCTRVNRNCISSGDLVFRYGISNGRMKIFHVGVYVGNGYVIHAKGRDSGVVIEQIDYNGTQYWNRFGRLNCLT